MFFQAFFEPRCAVPIRVLKHMIRVRFFLHGCNWFEDVSIRKRMKKFQMSSSHSMNSTLIVEVEYCAKRIVTINQFPTHRLS
jgi:hypothetical protein